MEKLEQLMKELAETGEEMNDILRQMKEIKAEENKPGKWEPEFPGDHYGITGYGEIQVRNFEPRYTENGMSYRSMEAAEYARDMYIFPTARQAQYIAEHIEKMEPDWVADWGDHKQEKWSAYYNYERHYWETAYTFQHQRPGQPYGPSKVILKMVDDINNGRFNPWE